MLNTGAFFDKKIAHQMIAFIISSELTQPDTLPTEMRAQLIQSILELFKKGYDPDMLCVQLIDAADEDSVKLFNEAVSHANPKVVPLQRVLFDSHAYSLLTPENAAKLKKKIQATHPEHVRFHELLQQKNIVKCMDYIVKTNDKSLAKEFLPSLASIAIPSNLDGNRAAETLVKLDAQYPTCHQAIKECLSSWAQASLLTNRPTQQACMNLILHFLKLKNPASIAHASSQYAEWAPQCLAYFGEPEGHLVLAQLMNVSSNLSPKEKTEVSHFHMELFWGTLFLMQGQDTVIHAWKALSDQVPKYQSVFCLQVLFEMALVQALQNQSSPLPSDDIVGTIKQGLISQAARQAIKAVLERTKEDTVTNPELWNQLQQIAPRHSVIDSSSAFFQSSDSTAQESDYYSTAAKQTFITAHKAKLRSETYPITLVKDDWTLAQILQHAQSYDNRSRRVCIDLGWLERDGSVSEGAPEIIKHTLNTLGNAPKR